MNEAVFIETLIEQLSSPDPTLRQKAAHELGRTHDTRAVVPLIHALQEDEDDETRAEAAQSLGVLKDPQALDALIAALNDPGWDMQMYKAGPVAENAAWALGQLADNRATAALVAVLVHVYWSFVRSAIVYALAAIGDSAAVPALITTLQTNELGEVRGAAASALGQLHDNRAVEPLIHALAESQLRSWVVPALGEIGDSRAIEPLRQILDEERTQTQLDQESGRIQIIIAIALHRLGDHRSDTLLYGALTVATTEIGARYIAARYLSSIGNKEAIATLVAMLDDPDAAMRWDAAETLGDSGDGTALAALARVAEADAGGRYHAIADTAIVSIRRIQERIAAQQ